MGRLRHRRSGAVVSVPDEKAARMGSEWGPVEKPAPKKKAPAKKAEPSPTSDEG